MRKKNSNITPSKKSPIIPFYKGNEHNVDMSIYGISKNKAFTLVELLVVIVILAILGTIGFLSFQSYNQYSRDVVRTSDLSLIARGIKIKQVQGGYAPKPENAVEIYASGSLIGYQGEFTSKIGKKYKIIGDLVDPLDGTNYVYSVDKNLNNFTVGGFLESDEVALGAGYPQGVPLQNTYAKEGRTLTTKGDKFGIILKDGETLTGTVDVVKTTDNYEVYFDNNEKIKGNGKILWKMIPNSSCARIQALGNISRKNKDENGGKYETINSEGKNITMYCDFQNKTGAMYSAIEDGDMEVADSDNWKNYTKSTEDKHSGDTSLKIIGEKTIKSEKFIYMDPTKKYKIEGWFKSSGSIDSKIYYGFAEYDKNFRRIDPDQVKIVEGTEAVLTNNINENDLSVIFSNSGSTCDNWGNSLGFSDKGGIAFNIDDSGNYGDLPNYNLSSEGFDNIINNGNTCTLTLKNPVGKNHSSGTKIRMHILGGGTYNYIGASSQIVPNSWTKYSGEVKGISKSGVDNNYFRKGTKYIKIMIIANYQQNSNAVLYIDDLKLIEE